VQAIDLISWNVHGSPGAPRTAERLTAIATELLRQPEPPHGLPDLVLLQEVWWGWQQEQLMDALGSGFEAVSEPRTASIYRRSGLLALRRRASPWRVTDEGALQTYEAGPPFTHLFEGDWMAGKGFQHLRVQRADAHLLVMNTHLQAPYVNDPHLSEREAQLAELNAGAEALLAEDEATMPALLVGDLNTHPGQRMFDRFVSGWTDLAKPTRERCQCGTHFPSGETPGQWIDHALARVPDGFALEARVARIANRDKDDPFSDHDGLRVHAQVGADASQAALPVAALLWADLARPQDRRGLLRGTAAALAATLWPLHSESAADSSCTTSGCCDATSVSCCGSAARS
jgi:endonuclease/exonuclease/phosphatase family metal-dependent hydrolase